MAGDYLDCCHRGNTLERRSSGDYIWFHVNDYVIEFTQISKAFIYGERAVSFL
jgi:hypothetical protein